MASPDLIQNIKHASSVIPLDRGIQKITNRMRYMPCSLHRVTLMYLIVEMFIKVVM